MVYIPFLAVLVSLTAVSGSMKMSSCKASAMWLEVPVELATLHRWVNLQLKPADRDQLVLETPADYEEGHHPVQIEFDNFHDCKAMLLPFPNFMEVAVQVPFSRFKSGSDLVHFQPWAFVDNIFGASAMMLLGADHVTAKDTGRSYSGSGNWSQWTAGEHAGESFSLSLRGANMKDGALMKSSSLEETDSAWHVLVQSKLSNELAYAPKILGGGEKFACNDIKWAFSDTTVSEITEGQLELSGAFQFLPVNFTGDVETFKKQMPNSRAYAIQSGMTAYSGC